MFYLGTHKPHWLKRTDVPLFINRRRLIEVKTLPRARGRWALDSGAFSELTLYNKWSIGAAAYVAEVRHLRDRIGNMDWAAIQDWMCEPNMLEKTGLTIAEHQTRTVRSCLELRAIAPDVPWTPVLQGWVLSDYLSHVEQYAEAGVDLTKEPIVGLGSVCRRQATTEFVQIVGALSDLGLRLHGFGVKTQGLLQVADKLASSDSMAWSRQARWAGKQMLAECAKTKHKTCNNCLPYALEWRRKLLERLPSTWQDDS